VPFGASGASGPFGARLPVVLFAALVPAPLLGPVLLAVVLLAAVLVPVPLLAGVLLAAVLVPVPLLAAVLLAAVVLGAGRAGVRLAAGCAGAFGAVLAVAAVFGSLTVTGSGLLAATGSGLLAATASCHTCRRAQPRIHLSINNGRWAT